jgi:thiamine biosynthesis lipoprotein
MQNPDQAKNTEPKPLNMYRFKAMNTTFATAGLTHKYSLQYKAWAHHVEKKVSRFLEDSELSYINREPGKIIIPSALLFELLSEALHYYEETDHLFSPFLQQQLKNIGYNRSFEQLQKIEYEFQINEKVFAKKNFVRTQSPLIINRDMKSICLKESSLLDLGGIAKGWTAQKMKDWLMADGVDSGLLDAGGDLAVWGKSPDQTNWLIALANPFHPDEDIGTLSIHKDCGIATSSSLKRRWKNEQGSIAHHIIDPRTEFSCQSDYVQVTLITPSLTTSEVYAKCLMILGSQEGPVFLEKKVPEAAWIGIRQDGAIDISPSLKTYCANWEFTDTNML